MLNNLALAAMAAADLERLRPHLHEQPVERGELLTAQGGLVTQVHFPDTAHLSNTVTFSDGRSAETFVMGREGASGLAPFLSDQPSAWSVEVKGDGVVWAIGAEPLRRAVFESRGLLSLFLALTYDYQAQAAVGVACAALHEAPARLARLILTTADRAETDRLQLTQEDMAAMLGLQRTSVTVAAGHLKTEGAIRYARGMVTLRDRAVLERRACECYRMVRDLGLPSV